MPEVTQLKRKYRTIFISDLHLGTKRSNTELLLNFMKVSESDTLYLVGDIIDNWALKRSWQWHQSHNDVIQKILRKARKGTRVVYIPGNHDEAFRDFAGMNFGNVHVRMNHIHKTADNKRYLILHGDEFDGVVLYAKWLAHLGDHAYGLAISLNHHFNRMRRLFGLPYWSLSAFLKRRVKRAVEFVGNFETAIVRKANQSGVDGVICGHIHTPEMRQIENIHYCNVGDWVESCSALVEHMDGRFELLNWTALENEEAVESKADAGDNRYGRMVSAG